MKTVRTASLIRHIKYGNVYIYCGIGRDTSDPLKKKFIYQQIADSTLRETGRFLD